MPLPPPDDYISPLARAFAAVTSHRRNEADMIVAMLRAELPARSRRLPINRNLQVAVLRRDRFSCRYCGMRTIPVPVLRAASLIWPEELPFNRNWRTDVTHPVYAACAATIDHLQPRAHGGSNSELSNLVTACWPCNLQKSEFTLHRLGWALAEITSSAWDGLIYAYPDLWEEGHPNATAGDVRYHLAWLAAFFPPGSTST